MEVFQASGKLILTLNRNFSDDDKEKCIPIICKIVRFADISRQEGLLALEKETEQENDFLLKQGIMLIVSGTDPTLVKHILQNFILSGNYSGFELLSRVIVMEGVLALQQGENPIIIGLRLSSLLGERYVLPVKQAMGKTEQQQKDFINNFLKEVANNKAFGEGERLEKELLSFDRMSIQAILWATDLRDLIIALRGCSFKLIQRIFFELSPNLSTNLTSMLINDWYNIGSLSKENIISAQNYVLEKIEELKNPGDIISFGDISQNTGEIKVASENSKYKFIVSAFVPLYTEDED